LAGRVLSTFKKQINEMKLVPAGGGCFELKIDGELAYSKLATKEFPDETMIVEMIQKKLKT
jgi:selenoprotein W-related protein